MRPLLSVCMIVKNEAELLPRFLRQAHGVWDELVVVDTGSTDETLALLAEAGATVLHREWNADFAAARNHGLDAATGEWIAVLDPDEMLSPGFSAEIRERIADETAGAATVRMINMLPHGHRRETRLLRVFRNDPEIRFRHAIHEDVSEGVAAYLARAGRQMLHLNEPVEHLGYTQERATARNKKARDTAILERLLAADPFDLYSHFKRLEQACFWEDRELWTRAANEAAAVLERDASRLGAMPYGGGLLALIADGLYPGDAAPAAQWLARWAEQAKPSAALRLRQGELAEARGLTADAAASFRAALELESITSNQQLASVRPRLGLARLAIAKGDLKEAQLHADAALPLAPRDPEALLLSLTLERARGGKNAVLRFATAHATRFGESSELHEAIGEGALWAGDVELSVAALLRAAGTPPSGPIAVRLATALVAAGEIDAARTLGEQLLAAQPAVGLVLLLCDLIEGHNSSLELDLSEAEADRHLRAMIGAVCAVGNADVLAALRSVAPAVATLFPWLPGVLESARARS